jgi:hypothetical protein
MGRTMPLFGSTKPRQRPRVMMHVEDAGHDDEDFIAKLGCTKCGTKTAWLKFKSITECKRGIPCEQCNRPSTNGDTSK